MYAQSLYKSSAGEKAVFAWYDEMLAHWPVFCETLNIPTRHGSTFVMISGKQFAPSLILLHGAGTNSAMWAGDIAAYSRLYRVYAVDLLGEPGKSAPNRLSWDSLAYAEWLEDVLDELKVKKASLLGLSQGAWTAIKFASYQPERIEKLVLISPAGIVPDRLWFAIRAIPLSLLGYWGIKRINSMLFGKQPVPKEVDEANALIMTHFRVRLGIIPLFSQAELQRLAMPVLVLVGEQDALRNGRKISERLRMIIPDLTTVVVPDAGHALATTTTYVLPFLEI